MNEKPKNTRLTGVYLEAFQSILKPTFINLEGLTLLYGPNSAGKSSIIDALNIIKKVVVKNDTAYSPSFFMRQDSRDHKCSIGVEIELGEIKKTRDQKVEKWTESEDSDRDNSHRVLFHNLKGHKVGIDFKGIDFDGVKISVDGDFLFEIEQYGETLYDDFERRLKNSELNDEDIFEKYQDNRIWGELKVNKKHPFFKYIGFQIQDFFSVKTRKELNQKNIEKSIDSNYQYQLFINDEEDLIKISGIAFDGINDYQSNFVEIGMGVHFIHKVYERNESSKMLDPEVEEFLYQHYDKTSENYKKYKNDRSIIYDTLYNIAQDFNLYLEGFLFHMREALQFSHVRGDRYVLDSKFPFYTPTYYKFDGVDKLATEYDHCQKYAEQLLNDHRFGKDGANKSKNDFINYSLKKYLPSFKNNQIIPEIFNIQNISSPSKENNFIVHLYVKINKLKLGFENVGSGLSYIFPILTSLSCSDLSFIEQPELHLHPKAQCEMGDVFISAFNKDSISVIESHSEHLVLRLLRRIRESTNNLLLPKDLKLSCRDVSIYFFDPQPEGHTEVKKIRIDKYGELMDIWPNGFFSERDGELF